VYTISRIANAIFEAKRATLAQVASTLEVSRTTAIRWLALMESEDLLRRTQHMSGRRGRPEAVYVPTGRLLKLVKSQSSETFAILNFQALKEVCKHLIGASCAYNASSQTCSAAHCPILHTGRE
jgi:predicted ArsR family transcriptional regulator